MKLRKVLLILALSLLACILKAVFNKGADANNSVNQSIISEGSIYSELSCSPELPASS